MTSRLCFFLLQQTVFEWAEQEEEKRDMAKGKKSVFFCQNCGYESSKWLGQCPGCREWNTFVEESVSGAGKGAAAKGSMVLVGGDPGIGKSTLLLQVCRQLTLQQHKVLYISGEESLRQIKLRAKRIGEFNEHLYLLCETNLEIIRSTIERLKPEAVVIDSIQFHRFGNPREF